MLQSRAELHKARLDALNAAQRHTSAAKLSTQAAASPMTQKAIIDLTAAQVPASASKLSVSQPPAQAAATVAAAKAPAPQAAQRASSQVQASADKGASAPPATKPAAAVAAAHRSSDKQQPSVDHLSAAAAVMGAAGGKLDGSAGTQGRRPVSPSSSRQAPKRRRSRSVSPSVAGSKGGRSQAGSQRQAASSARQPVTRCVALRATLAVPLFDIAKAYDGLKLCWNACMASQVRCAMARMWSLQLQLMSETRWRCVGILDLSRSATAVFMFNASFGMHDFGSMKPVDETLFMLSCYSSGTGLRHSQANQLLYFVG